MNVLWDHGVKGTFFLAGAWVEKFPRTVQRIHREGHELGNHSQSHLHMRRLGKGRLVEEIRRPDRLIEQLTGVKTRYFRPPYGEYSRRLLEISAQLGYRVIRWDADSLDWKNLSAAAIRKRVLDRAKKGSIVLFHCDKPNTVKALPDVIAGLIKRNLTLTTVGDLLEE